jgi:serine protease Do
MSTRTRTIASFFTVAMAASLLGAIVTTQVGGAAGPVAPAPAAAAAAAAAPDTVARPAGGLSLDTFQQIARLQTPAVVNINTKRTVRRRGGNTTDPFRDFFGDDFMDRFFGPQGRGENQTQRSLGSGFIIDKAGYILTNRHVVEGADEISVTLSTNRDYQAKLIGRDARTDVALLKIEPRDDLTAIGMGDSDQTQVGEWVMAVGNPFGLGGNSVTVGVVSYKGRPLGLSSPNTPIEMLQTDASINPGNSGGPLINTRGEVIGINTLIITQGMPQSAGVGFAVPINVAKNILPQLREKGRVTRGWLGVTIGPVGEDMAKSYGLKEARGAVINDVQEGSPAEKAGVRPEDVVIAIDGRPVEDNSDLSRDVAARAPGSTVRLRILRGGQERDISITLGTFPDEGTDDASAEGQGQEQLGMTLRDLTPELADRLNAPRSTRGAVVMEVESGSNAEEAGLQRGDIIVSVNGQEIRNVDEFQAAVARARPDGLARLRVRRGAAHTVTILKLG